jgi:protein tyrosine phosphatase (PTP) superfamily phosphohydrolase (DUF442 family)
MQADADTAATGAGITPNVTATVAPSLVQNFEMVSNGIWRGAAPSPEAMSALAKDGVRTIVDLRMNCSGVTKESSQAKKLGLRYYHFALGFNKPEQAKVEDILAVMTDPVNQPVFIHCRQGADRTGMLVGMYRRGWLGWSFPRTWTEMRHHHFKPFLLAMKNEVRKMPAPAAHNLHDRAPLSVTQVTTSQSSPRLSERSTSLIVAKPTGIEGKE